MKKTILVFLLISFLFGNVISGEKDKQKLSYYELSRKFSTGSGSDIFNFGFDLSGRKPTGLIYSAIVPGTGQFYLGHQLKGAAFTILSTASLVTALISQNDIVAMNEKIESLENDYTQANTYTKADEVWVKMVEAKKDADDYKKQRNLFYGIYVGVWALNILDYLFNSPDKGAMDFSMKSEKDYKMGIGVLQNSPALSLQINF